LAIKDHLSGMEQYSRACRVKKGGRTVGQKRGAAVENDRNIW
jgi:hypothetical protein